MDEIDEIVEANKALDEATHLPHTPPADPSALSPPDSRELGTLNFNASAPYERSPDETDLSWHAFKTYRDLGPSRSLAQMCRDHPEININSCYIWVKKYDWHSRVTSWDIHEERIYQLKRAQTIREMAERHGELIVDALEAMSAPFEALKLRFDRDPEAMLELSEEKLSKLLDLASKMARNMPGLMASERAARGMPDSVVEIQGEVTHTHGIDRSGVATILDALRESGAFETATGVLEDGELDGRSASDDPAIVEAEVVAVHPDDTAP